MSLKILSVFSGIGSFEQSLRRLNMEHEILLACDNGDITIEVDYEKELESIRKIDGIDQKISYANELYKKGTRRTNFVEKSYKENYPEIKNKFLYDIKLLDGNPFKNQVDVYVGGSPCQSFSAIGGREGFEDTRGTLFYDYVRVLSETNPKVFIYENVFGLVNHDKGRTWKIIKKTFDSLGYHYKFKVMNSKDYGIPQSRRRIFVVGFKEKEHFNKFEFPKEVKLEFTMQDFLLDNTEIGKFIYKNGKIVLENDRIGQKIEERYFLSDKLLKYCLSPGTKNFMHKDAKIDLPIARALLATMGNSHRSSINNYVTTKGRVRALHPRETHRLMGFSDEYKIVVSNAQAYRQSGNSIVVDVFVHLFEKIKEAMEW